MTQITVASAIKWTRGSIVSYVT